MEHTCIKYAVCSGRSDKRDYFHFTIAFTSSYILSGPVAIALGGACYVLMRGAYTLHESAENMDIGIPFTRANTTDMPASESLVRASQEPLQAQEMILLRAAMETTEGQEEQLLRASGGQE